MAENMGRRADLLKRPLCYPDSVARRRIFVSFAGSADSNDRDWRRRQRVLARSARRVGFDPVISWTRRRLRKTDFYARHRELLDAERGAGYWAWKPYVIHEALRNAAPGDSVVYCDVGRGRRTDGAERSQLRSGLDALLDWCEEENDGLLPGVYIPVFGPNRRWTKRDCFVHMGCDEPRFWDHPQVQASFSVWRSGERALSFVHEWMTWCTKPEIIDDGPSTAGLPDFPDFVEHRHDQSILTNLVIRDGLPCYGPPDRWVPPTKDINTLNDRIAQERVQPLR